ncbi:membrane-bound lytic murein transglycosylase MltF [bacterium]|nr:membrane-bound lytic murein transglycosylase MltF [bacterium]
MFKGYILSIYIRLLLVIATIALFLIFMGCMAGDSQKLRRPVKVDFEQIKQRDTLRVLTRNHPLSYYLYRGTRRGFDFELIQKFAEDNDMVIEVVIPPNWNDLIPWLYAGKGDVIAALMTATPERAKVVNFTQSYLEVRQVAVGTNENPPPQVIEEFSGRTVHVRKGTSYEERLRQMRMEGIDVNINPLEDDLDTDDPVERVAKGELPLTIVDNTIATLEQHFFPGLIVGAAVTEPQQIAWAVRPNSPELKSKLNEFLVKEDRSEFFNVLKQRYFENRDRFLRHRSIQLALRNTGEISNYDKYFKQAGEKYDIDWVLLAAQSYHESRFISDKVSWAGAVGLMQLMPRTAHAMGVKDIKNPEQNIMGGTKYMRRLFNLYSEAEGEDRWALAFAAYNTGIGHLADARKLTRNNEGDPNKWDDVREWLIKLEDPKYYRNAQYGFTRGNQVVRYVEDIFYRYQIFKSLLPDVPPDLMDTEDVLAFGG